MKKIIFILGGATIVAFVGGVLLIFHIDKYIPKPKTTPPSQTNSSNATTAADESPVLTDEQLIHQDSLARQQADAAGWRERYYTVLEGLLENSVEHRMLQYVRFSYLDTNPSEGDLTQDELSVSEFNFNPYGFINFRLGIQGTIRSPSGKRTIVTYGTFDTVIGRDGLKRTKPRNIRGFFVREGDMLLHKGEFTESLATAPRFVNIKWRNEDSISYAIESYEGGIIQNNALIGATKRVEPSVLYVGQTIPNDYDAEFGEFGP